MIRRAVLSEDGMYRYSLSRRWGRGRGVLWIMLNPSTADAEVDDPTIRRCIGFSRAWGCDAMEVVNLYALRSSEPAVLRRHADPIGPENDAWIQKAAGRAAKVVAAWGAWPWAGERAEAVRAGVDRPMECLGLTREGRPRHPLYAPSGKRPGRFSPRGVSIVAAQAGAE